MTSKLTKKVENIENSISQLEYDISRFEYYNSNNFLEELQNSAYLCNQLKYFIFEEYLVDSQHNLNYCKNKVTQQEINNIFKIQEKIVIVDNIKYLLIKNNSIQTENIYYTYLINNNITNRDNKNNITDKKQICCHCNNKLNYNIIKQKENKKQKEYYCEKCDNIKLDFASIIIFENKTIYSKDINWQHRLHSQDEICEFNSKSIELSNNIFIKVDKKTEMIKIDGKLIRIVWYFSNNICKYAYVGLQNMLILCRNSIILFNEHKLLIQTNEDIPNFYKIIINNIELSGYRFHSDLLKMY